MTQQEFLDCRIRELVDLQTRPDAKYMKIHMMECNQDKEEIHSHNWTVEFTPDKPPISLKNLAKFALRYPEDPFPKANFTNPVNSPHHVPKRALAGKLVYVYLHSQGVGCYYCHSDTYYYFQCKITDERWTHENLEV